MSALIGLSGYARAGKDTAGKALVEIGYTRVSFADKLRDFLYALDPLIGADWGSLAPVVDVIGWERAKDFYPQVRELLQRCGTEAGRKVLGENVWVDATLRDLPDKVVVTDVRFPNEAQAIKDRGGIVVRIERPGFAATNGHASEVAMDDWPFDSWITNSGNQAELGQLLKAVVLQ